MSKINLSNNSIGGQEEGEPGVKALAAALQVNTSITEINLASNGLDAECAEILAPAIQGSRVMSILDVSNNKIGVEGAKALAPAM